jgi:hypothetical protein
VLERNIFDRVDADNILDVNVDYVFLGARLVHSRDGADRYREPAAA